MTFPACGAGRTPFSITQIDPAESICLAGSIEQHQPQVFMGWYENHILPHCVDWVMRGERFSRLRQSLLADVSGAVLEVGFGSGLNLPHYPSAVTRLYALDPSLLGRRLAEPRIRRAPFPVEFVDLEHNRIPLPDHSVDMAVSTWTLCTIPDPISVLREIHRVVKPQGGYYFLEHGLSPDGGVARFQNAWNPVQKIFAGGCHVNRQIDRLIEQGGWRLERMENFYMEGPKFLAWLYRGFAQSEKNFNYPKP